MGSDLNSVGIAGLYDLYVWLVLFTGRVFLLGGMVAFCCGLLPVYGAWLCGFAFGYWFATNVSCLLSVARRRFGCGLLGWMFELLTCCWASGVGFGLWLFCLLWLSCCLWVCICIMSVAGLLWVRWFVATLFVFGLSLVLLLVSTGCCFVLSLLFITSAVRFCVVIVVLLCKA